MMIQKRQKRIWCSILLAVLPAFGIISVAAQADHLHDNNNLASTYITYTYDYNGNAVVTPDAFIPDQIIHLQPVDGQKLSNPSDLFVLPNGGVVIADTGNDRVLFLDSDFGVSRVLSSFENNGVTDSFNAPSGVFVDGGGELYVADRRNSRVVHFDHDLNYLREIGKPQTTLLEEGYNYAPIALAVNKSGQLYVVAEGINMGVLHFNAQGEFAGFLGAQRASYNPIDYLWKTLLSDNQQRRMMGFVPSEYNDIAIDSDGFLYVTTDTIDGDTLKNAVDNRIISSETSPVKKLNAAGTDVLRRQGYFSPMGDIRFGKNSEGFYETSLINSVAIGKNNVYALLDQRRSRIFCYSQNGVLLYAFSAKGSQIGQSRHAASLAYRGEDLLVLDRESGFITLFGLTEYGRLINSALSEEAAFNYSRANELWTQVLRKNANFDPAYDALAEAAARVGDYTGAMTFYEYSGNKRDYSAIFREYRGELSRQYLPVILIAAAVLIFGLIKLFSYISRRNNAEAHYNARSSFSGKLLYSLFIPSHPLDGFWDLRHEGRGGGGAAAILALILSVSMLARRTLSNPLFSSGQGERLSIIRELLTVLLTILVWAVANWSVTSLMNGEGRMRDILQFTCYSFAPISLLSLLSIPLSYVLTLEESMYLSMINSIALGWTGLILFCGNIVTHQYTFLKSVISVVLSVIGMGIILFITLLTLSTYQQIFYMIRNLFQEIVYRVS